MWRDEEHEKQRRREKCDIDFNVYGDIEWKQLGHDKDEGVEAYDGNRDIGKEIAKWDGDK